MHTIMIYVSIDICTHACIIPWTLRVDNTPITQQLYEVTYMSMAGMRAPIRHPCLTPLSYNSHAIITW